MRDIADGEEIKVEDKRVAGGAVAVRLRPGVISPASWRVVCYMK